MNLRLTAFLSGYLKEGADVRTVPGDLLAIPSTTEPRAAAEDIGVNGEHVATKDTRNKDSKEGVKPSDAPQSDTEDGDQ